VTRHSLLIVEDNAKLSQSIRSQLRSNFSILQAPTLRQAFNLLETQPPFDLILLDRTLPDGDGLDLISKLDEFYPQTRICVLSQRDALAEKMRGFDQGADVYLCKPIHLKELKAQVMALIRRGRVYHNHVIRCGPIRLDTSTHSLNYKGCELKLTQRESVIVGAFLDNPQHFLSSSQLFNLFWEIGHEPNPSLVHVSIQRLRRKIKPLQVTIHSHYGAGYQLRFP